MQMHNPAHPGKVLKEYMGDAEVTSFATRLGVDRTTLSRLLNGRASISAQMALKLEQVLGTSAEMWMNMQAIYDLWTARQKSNPARPSHIRHQRRASA
ncbi:MAG TPA: HigA family addiction module antitoxin [Acidisarcina sp.]